MTLRHHTQRILAGLVALVATVLVAALPARAADTAMVRIIGFSEGGRLFAFEQFGIQDGSGFPYSEIFALDLAADAFLPGTPVKKRIDDEMAPLARVRAEAASAFSKAVNADFSADPGLVLAYNPVSELDANPHSVRFSHVQASPPFGPVDRVVLTEIPLAAPSGCPATDGPFMGFRLTVERADGEVPAALVHEDKAIPASRHCALGYRIAAIIGSLSDPESRVALIEVRSYGFEGTDGRFIAVPLRTGGAQP